MPSLFAPAFALAAALVVVGQACARKRNAMGLGSIVT
jgi:hypothetical protein